MPEDLPRKGLSNGMKISLSVVVTLVLAAIAGTWAFFAYISSTDANLELHIAQAVGAHEKTLHDQALSKARFEEFHTTLQDRLTRMQDDLEALKANSSEAQTTLRFIARELEHHREAEESK